MAKFANIGTIVILLLGVFSMCQAAEIEDLLKDKALVERQIRCVLDQGPCDAIGLYAKESLRKAISNRCARCSRLETDNANKVGTFIASRYPREWAAILAKYR